MDKTEKIIACCVVALILGLTGLISMFNEEICPPNQSYQVIKYEPYFQKNGQPAYRPVYGCK